MAENNFEAVAGAEAFGQLFGKEHRAMLAAGASERNHQIFEAALLIVGDDGVDQRQDAGEKLMHGLLLIEIVDDRSILARECLEALFAARIGEAAAIENKAAAVAAVVLRQALVKGKTKDAHDEVVRVGGEALQFLRSQHAFESVHQRGKRDGEPDVVEQPAQVFQGVRDALEKMSAALVETAKAVGAEGLHDADINVGVVVAQEGVSVELDETGKPVEIIIEEVLAEVGREIGLGVV